MIDPKSKYRMRVENCIGTIIDVHRRIDYPEGDEEFLCQFERLREAISRMDMSGVSEQDVLIVEQATNALLGEFKPIFEAENSGPVFQKAIH